MKWMVHGKRLPGYYPRILCIVLALLLVGLSYYFQKIALPGELKKQEAYLRSTMDLDAMEQDLVLVLKENTRLSKGSAIDEEALAKIELVERPVLFLPEHYLSSLDEIEGQIVERNIGGGEILVLESLKTQDSRQEGYYRLISVSLREDLLGSLEAGRNIDLLAHRDDGTYEILVSKTPLMQVQTTEEGRAEILIPVDDYEQRLIEKVRGVVTFSARLYLDSTQPQSPCIESPTKRVEKYEN